MGGADVLSPFYPATGPWLTTASSLRGGREVSKPEVVRTEFTAYGLSFGFAVGWYKVTLTWHYRTVTQSSLVTAFQKTTTAPGPHTRTGPLRFCLLFGSRGKKSPATVSAK